jgi:magnesium-transporting ATPase (P-type)
LGFKKLNDRAIVKAKARIAALLEEFPEEREESFDPDVMMMATVHQTSNGFLIAVKGTPQAVNRHRGG